tara:strand:+ start:301 stop:1332 length:1032 start_codon:yes stop_codon:yes gene_type:complete
MSVFRSIATGYLGAKIANTQANDELKARVLESAGTNFYTNILPDAIADEKLRKSNYESLAAINPNLAELADINGFTASKEGMEKFDQFREENKLKDPDALKNLNFETDFNTRYNTRVKTFEEKYNPILDQIGIKELGGLGFNTVESLVGDKQMKSEDMAKGPVPSDSFASSQLSDYFIPKGEVMQIPENEYARVAASFRDFKNVISFDPRGNAKFNFRGTKDVEYNALRQATNDVASNYYNETQKKVNVGAAVEKGSENLYRQTQGHIMNNVDNYKELQVKKPGDVPSQASGQFNLSKVELLQYLSQLGSKSEQRYYALSFPAGVSASGINGDVRQYLLDITR